MQVRNSDVAIFQLGMFTRMFEMRLGRRLKLGPENVGDRFGDRMVIETTPKTELIKNVHEEDAKVLKDPQSSALPDYATSRFSS